MNKVVNFAPTIALAATLLCAQPPRSPDVQWKAAQHKEQVEGDLKGAIDQYRKLAQTADRALAAKALVHMADCYRRLGDAEARKIYERVLRDYSDQKEAAALARTRLGDARLRDSGINTRQVWAKFNPRASVSPDGRYLTFTDDKTGNLGIHDLTTGEDRLVTTSGNWGNEPQYASSSVFSPDQRQVAFYWEHDAKGREPRIELRVVNLDQSGASPKILFFNHEAWALPYSWSPDGKWIAVTLARKDNSRQLALVSAVDGSLRVLKSIEWRGPNRIVFSPDGRYLAYDISSGANSTQRDVYVLSVDGSVEFPVVVHGSNDAVVGWTSDQKHLLFSSDRSGRTAIWAQPVRDGRVQGSPTPLTSEFSGDAIGLTRSGSLYYSRRPAFADIYVASIDFETGKVTRSPVKPIERLVGYNGFSDLSADGTQLSFVFLRGGGNATLGIRSMLSGDIKELPVIWNGFIGTAPPRLSPDGRSFLTTATDTNGRRMTFRVDADSGTLHAVASDEPMRLWPMWAADGKSFYFWRNQSTAQRNLTTGEEREIFHGRCRSVSPDGKYLACSKQNTLFAVPVGGAEPRELAQLDPSRSYGQVSAWTPDGQGVLYSTIEVPSGQPQAAAKSPNSELWLASLKGDQPRRIELNLTRSAHGFRIHPDGKQVVYSDAPEAGSADGGTFVIENLFATLNRMKR